MSRNAWRDRIKNEYICKKLEVINIDDKIRESWLRWFGHVQQGQKFEWVRKGDRIIVNREVKSR